MFDLPPKNNTSTQLPQYFQQLNIKWFNLGF